MHENTTEHNIEKRTLIHRYTQMKHRHIGTDTHSFKQSDTQTHRRTDTYRHTHTHTDKHPH